jgi:hypothetical protein
MQNWKRLLTAAATTAVLTTCAVQVPLSAQGRGRGAEKKENKAQATDRETPRWSMPGRVIPQKYEEPAFARGFEAGRERGQADAAKGERYDPVASREYRDGDPGYAASYGSRDAYKSNYRAGFRQGYEEGYRKVNR